MSGEGLTREQRLAVDRVLASRPMPMRPSGMWAEGAAKYGGPFAMIASIFAWGVVLMLVKRHVSIVPFFVTGLGVQIVLLAVWSVLRRRDIAQVRRHQAFICPRCRYPLTELADDEVCPECATLYTRAQVVDVWKWAYKLKDRFPTSCEEQSRVAYTSKPPRPLV